uniref:Solute carrier organic anion transporter family member 1C1 n=1 Tax=Laticauda laticaudata TaxID=8630 RepID=A0A8C5RCS3_LATLA
MILSIDRSSSRTEPSTSKEKRTLCGGIKIFLGALLFVYFAKTLSGSYLKSIITQIERRFDISSSLVGLIVGSFEIGNFLIIILLSYFGAKLHRPKIIGAGSSSSVCPGCEKEAGISMWIYILLGNLPQGIGETAIQPLGIAYIDDYAPEERVPFYIVAILSPILGFLLGSLCAKLCVDIGFVDMGTIAITHKDPHWIGAWWLGYLIAGMVSILAAIPFWFLLKHLPRTEIQKDSTEQSRFIAEDNKDCCRKQYITNICQFLPSLKNFLGNPVYFFYFCSRIIQFSPLIGMLTYKPKYMEQQFGQSSSKTNFIIGFINIPAVTLEMFSGSLFMKKFRLNFMLGAAKISSISSFFGYLLLLTLFTTGFPRDSWDRAFNAGCACSKNEWDPICGENGITYISACLAGCKTSNGTFYDCSFPEASSRTSSALFGPCPHGKGCSKMLLYFLVISVIASYTLSTEGTPGYILLLR